MNRILQKAYINLIEMCVNLDRFISGIQILISVSLLENHLIISFLEYYLSRQRVPIHACICKR
jgi:hypothetical protein